MRWTMLVLCFAPTGAEVDAPDRTVGGHLYISVLEDVLRAACRFRVNASTIRIQLTFRPALRWSSVFMSCVVLHLASLL
jgi:hypothetical protein